MAFELTSLQAIETFVAANGRVFNYEEVEIVRLRVRDAREAITLLGPVRRSGLLVNNYARADVLATAGLMLEAADMIIDDLLREVEERSVDIQHVRGLRSNGEFIRSSSRSPARCRALPPEPRADASLPPNSSLLESRASVTAK